MEETDFVRNSSKAQLNNKQEGYLRKILRNSKGSSLFFLWWELRSNRRIQDESVSGVLNFMNMYYDDDDDDVHTRFNHFRLIFNTKYLFNIIWKSPPQNHYFVSSLRSEYMFKNFLERISLYYIEFQTRMFTLKRTKMVNDSLQTVVVCFTGQYRMGRMDELAT